MDTISSAEFRKRYASLEQAVEVTVNGHLLGTWFPAKPWLDPTLDWRAAADAAKMQQNLDADVARFNSRPFTPVPKKGK